MKTVIKIQETGTRKYKKAMINVFALLLGLVLFSSTVGSQNSFETGKLTNDTIQRINIKLEQPPQDSEILASAHHLVIVHTSPTAVKISSFKIEPLAEESLEIESWMTELNNFGQVVNYEDEKEEALELEEWMINELNFKTKEKGDRRTEKGNWRQEDGEGTSGYVSSSGLRSPISVLRFPFSVLRFPVSGLLSPSKGHTKDRFLVLN